MSVKVCKFLDWDSAFFGVRIARLQPTRLTPATLTHLSKWCQENQIGCVYFLSVADDSKTIALATEHGFQLVDIRMTMQRCIGPAEAVGASSARPAGEQDGAALKGIARTAHSSSRFFFDPHFSRTHCEALYETWIERSCAGWADEVFVVELDGIPAGYCTCHLDRDGDGSIGLMGLAEAARGRGLARELLSAALGYFRAHGAARVRVVTQGRNRQAQRFYQKSGFLTDSVMLWHHLWLPGSQGYSRTGAEARGDA